MQKIIVNQMMGFALILLGSIGSVSAQEVQFDSAIVRLAAEKNAQQIEVEFANTFEQRAKGLMFRASLCDDCGMLFEYSYSRIGSMWMKNTLIPLDVAFVDKDGEITDIIAMQPHDMTSVRSSREVLYALEMNLGWFAKHGFKVGDKMQIIEK